MTEAEWLACQELKTLLDYLVGRATDRKFRLFGCACCRRIWPLLIDERRRRAVSVAERCADDLVSEDETATIQKEMVDCRTELAFRPSSLPVDSWAHAAAEAVLFDTPFWKPNAASQGAYTAAWTAAEAAWRMNGEAGPEAETHRQLVLLRDIFENPYRPHWVDPEWLAVNDNIIRLAEVMYACHDFSSMPFLSDALEEAGCDDADILNHCRGPGLHVRGCWVVDLILGKS